MLTPVDIQQKKFHVGLGYDKKDVNTFLTVFQKAMNPCIVQMRS